MTSKAIDIVIFGATGFTGELTAAHLAQCKERDQLKWAIAGRSQAKLNDVKKRLAQQFSQCKNLEIITADISDYKSLKAMTSQARVLITTVGPYLNYGEAVVKACIETDTHYVDLTGEPEFVDSMVHLYDEVAVKKKLKIGFNIILNPAV